MWFLDQGLTRRLIVALRDWARMLQAAGVSCTDQGRADEELCTRLHRVEIYSWMLEVVGCFCMRDAETRRWALKDYLPSEVAYLLRPCLLHVHA